MNKVVLTGRVTKDIELRYTPSQNTPVASFSLAVDRMKKDETDFFNCTAWNKLAEIISQYVSKGNKILVEGILQNRKYTDQQGNNRIITEIVASNIEFLENKKKDELEKNFTEVSDESDLPF